MTEPKVLTNGPGAAAVLAAGVGMFCLGALSFAGDKSAGFKAAMVWYKPTGALSGVTTIAIVAWLAVWAVLEARWKAKTVDLGRVGLVSAVLLGLSVLLTFPPFVDLF